MQFATDQIFSKNKFRKVFPFLGWSFSKMIILFIQKNLIPSGYQFSFHLDVFLFIYLFYHFLTVKSLSVTYRGRKFSLRVNPSTLATTRRSYMLIQTCNFDL